jgi:uncharacterized protein (DUF2147 family)
MVDVNTSFNPQQMEIHMARNKSETGHIVERRIKNAAFLIPMFALLLSLAPMALGQAASADELVGVWESLDHTFKIEMFKADRDYEAHLLYGNHVVEKDGTFKTDAKNPDPGLRSRSLKGIVLIKGLMWDKGQWSGGTLYDGSSGSTYQCKAEIKDGLLLLRGFRGTPLFWRNHQAPEKTLGLFYRSYPPCTARRLLFTL